MSKDTTNKSAGPEGVDAHGPDVAVHGIVQLLVVDAGPLGSVQNLVRKSPTFPVSCVAAPRTPSENPAIWQPLCFVYCPHGYPPLNI